jgi:hypothetical protein|tara:strand:+ start:12002 stop:12700 length:699 start_codon:yes stop_codon:yes gene_type:complete
MNFIKKIFEDKIDESVHSQFIKFGKGEYKGKFLLGFWKTKKIKVKASSEFANDLVLLCSSFGISKVSGIVLSKKNLSELMSENNIEGNSESKKGGLYYQNNIHEQELKEDQLIELEKESYSVLLDMEGSDFKLKIKKKLPKPGKSEDKVDDNFCQLEADEKYSSKIKEDFFWDMPESKKIGITHNIIINEIVMPTDEKDYEKIRKLSKRKGKIIRKAIIEEKEIIKEKEFLA